MSLNRNATRCVRLRNCYSIKYARLRFASSSAASQAAAALMERFASKTIVKKQFLDGNQLQKLALTLGRPSLGGRLMTEAPPPAGCSVPPGHHLVYFTPGDLENELGADGSDRSANPPGRFTRRMWAGGEMFWPAALTNGDEGPVLKVGEEVEERTTLLSAAPKHSSRSGDMILVDVKKELWTPRGLAVTDRRSWIFRQELDPSQLASSNTSKGSGARELYKRSSLQDSTDTLNSKSIVRRLSWSPVALFRFSALTFNGHRIHYDEAWAQQVEGHKGIVVHGPLNLISMLDYWQDVHGKGEPPAKIEYRAMAPIYADESYLIRTGEVKGETDENATYELQVEKNGQLCMRGLVTAHA